MITGSIKVWVLVSESINLALQESAIVLAKLLLPQIFEKMAMHDLRALVAERSIMNLYIRGETIEIPYHSIGFLLEGFLKTQGVEELIISPATLLPSHGSLSFQSLESSGTRRIYLLICLQSMGWVKIKLITHVLEHSKHL